MKHNRRAISHVETFRY